MLYWGDTGGNRETGKQFNQGIYFYIFYLYFIYFYLLDNTGIKIF